MERAKCWTVLAGKQLSVVGVWRIEESVFRHIHIFLLSDRCGSFSQLLTDPTDWKNKESSLVFLSRSVETWRMKSQDCK